MQETAIKVALLLIGLGRQNLANSLIYGEHVLPIYDVQQGNKMIVDFYFGFGEWFGTKHKRRVNFYLSEIDFALPAELIDAKLAFKVFMRHLPKLETNANGDAIAVPLVPTLHNRSPSIDGYMFTLLGFQGRNYTWARHVLESAAVEMGISDRDRGIVNMLEQHRRETADASYVDCQVPTRLLSKFRKDHRLVAYLQLQLELSGHNGETPSDQDPPSGRSQIPEGWVVKRSVTHKSYYYVNVKSNKSQWQTPSID